MFAVLTDRFNRFQFSYNGRLATLKSPSDIAAWIAERKKRYPTKARVEEKVKRKEEEAMNVRNRREEQKRLKKEASDQKQRDLDREAKAKLKAEKLRKQYEKAQRRVVEMEAKKAKSEESGSWKEGEPNVVEQVAKNKVKEETRTAESDVCQMPAQAEVNSHPVNPSLGFSTSAEISDMKESVSLDAAENAAVMDNETGISVARDISNTQCSGPDPLTPTSQPTSPYISTSLRQAESSPPSLMVDSLSKEPPSKAQSRSDSRNLENETDSSHSLSDTSSDLSSDDSDDSSSEESSSSNDAPNEATSKRAGPAKVGPSRATKRMPICKLFLANGRCKRGDRCRYLHKLPERGTASREKAIRGIGKKGAEREEKRERMTLYQRVSLEDR